MSRLSPIRVGAPAPPSTGALPVDGVAAAPDSRVMTREFPSEIPDPQSFKPALRCARWELFSPPRLFPRSLLQTKRSHLQNLTAQSVAWRLPSWERRGGRR